jgi:tetratricopeptide (TPR) repeat protein
MFMDWKEFDKKNNQAMQLQKAGSYNEAIQIFEQLLEELPERDHYGTIHQSLAICYEETGQFDLAEKYFQASIAKNDGTQAFFPSNYSLFLEDQGRLKEALD